MAYAMLILVALISLMPIQGVGASDKLLHFLTYFLLSMGFVSLADDFHRIKWTVIGLMAYGVVIEFLQGLTGYRMMEAMDMLANSAGVLTGLLVRFTSIPEWLRQWEHRWF